MTVVNIVEHTECPIRFSKKIKANPAFHLCGKTENAHIRDGNEYRKNDKLKVCDRKLSI